MCSKNLLKMFPKLVWVLVRGPSGELEAFPLPIFASTLGPGPASPQVAQKLAAARSTGAAAHPLQQNRGNYRGYQPAGSRYHYKIVMFWQDKFLR
jgi:hypothetical protein